MEKTVFAIKNCNHWFGTHFEKNLGILERSQYYFLFNLLYYDIMMLLKNIIEYSRIWRVSIRYKNEK